MFPAHHQQHHHHHHNLSKQNQYSGYGSRCGDSGGTSYLEVNGGGGGSSYHEYCSVSDQACLGSDLMAEDESRSESNNNIINDNTNEAGSSLKDEEKDDQWLQLSIGGRGSCSSSHQEHQLKLDQMPASRESGRLIELDLLPPGGGGGSGNINNSLQMRPLNLAPTIFQVPDFRAPFPTTSPLFFQHQGIASSSTTNTTTFPFHHHLQQQQQETNYLAFRPAMVTPSFSSLVAPPPGSYYSRPFHLHGGQSGASGGMDLPGPSLSFRVVEPPRRPQSGVWFMLQASQNQLREPHLPQIPRSYIRIKDGRMTVRLLMKYLVNKLRLDNESEVEIRCRGQQLLPFLTLQHVRDNVWRNNTNSTNSPRNNIVSSMTLLPNTGTTTDHLMVLHYGRNA